MNVIVRDIMIAKLESDLAIIKEKKSTLNSYCHCHVCSTEIRVAVAELKEIERQLTELKK